MKRYVLYITLFLSLLLCACGVRPATGAADSTEAKETAVQETLHEHSYESKVTPPTCTEKGADIYTCSCGHFYSEEIAPTGHDYSSEVFTPTCTEQGFSRYTCKNCGRMFSQEFVDPLGHSLEKGETIPPTTTSNGYTVYTCTVCGEMIHSDTVPKLADPNKPSTPSAPPQSDLPPSVFDDCVFIGDSVSMMLEIYNRSTGIFGRATFLTRESFSLHNCINNGWTYNYNGMQLAPEDAVAACGAKKVFIMLGTNDIGWANIDKTVSNMGILVSRIRAKNPGVQIIIQSQTPIYHAGQKGGLTNARVNEYNEKLKAYAASNGCAYVDVASHLKDANGGLAAQYTSDNYVHITGAACIVWNNVLKAFLE